MITAMPRIAIAVRDMDRAITTFRDHSACQSTSSLGSVRPLVFACRSARRRAVAISSSCRLKIPRVPTAEASSGFLIVAVRGSH